mmetsp:Transcript_15894/g.43689  ORF Transcript_15894/g.43689 Transcript_15894/m.43689 type:complete len:284 (-) Transcript_15894:678-1529(-)
MVFYHRFFAFKSYEEHDRFNIATTALFLASKVEETPRKLKDVVIEAYKTQHTGAKVPEPESRDLYERREKVLISERILLQTLGFDLSIEHPYRPLLGYVKSITGTRDLAQIAWNFINDSLRTTVCLQYSPRYVAAAALSLAADHLRATKKVEIKLPTLYSSFSVTEQGVLEVTKLMRKIYPEKEGVTNRPAGPAVGSETRAPNGVAKPDHNAGAHGESNATAPTREGAAPASTTSTASTPVAQRDAAGQSAESAPVGTKRCNDTTVELSGGAGHHPKRPKEEV